MCSIQVVSVCWKQSTKERTLVFNYCCDSMIEWHGVGDSAFNRHHSGEWSYSKNCLSDRVCMSEMFYHLCKILWLSWIIVLIYLFCSRGSNRSTSQSSSRLPFSGNDGKQRSRCKPNEWSNLSKALQEQLGPHLDDDTQPAEEDRWSWICFRKSSCQSLLMQSFEQNKPNNCFLHPSH